MTEKDFVKRLEHWFPLLSLNDFDRKRIKGLLQEFKGEEKVIVKYIREEFGEVKAKSLPTIKEFKQVAAETCEKYGIKHSQLLADGSDLDYFPYRRRAQELIRARRFFVREMQRQFPYVTLVELTAFLGYKCHSSVINLLRGKSSIQLEEITLQEAI